MNRTCVVIAMVAVGLIENLLTAGLANAGIQETAAASVPRPGESEVVAAVGAPSITIVEHSFPRATQDFQFSACQGGACAPFALDDDTDPTLPNSISASGLALGTYTITQLPTNNNWVLDDIFCDTGETIDFDNGIATIKLRDSKQVTCTFTNRSPSLTIIEDSVPNSGQDFVFAACQGGCAPFALDDDTDPTLPNAVSGSGLAPGTYTITQSPNADWTLTDLSCTTGETIDLQNRQISITLGPTEYATCTFTNRATAITIVQNTVPDGPQDFSYVSTLGPEFSQFTLDDDPDPTVPLPSSVTAFGVTPGPQTITQEPTPGYDLLSISCDPWGQVDLANRQVQIWPGVGQPVTCTFTNRPTLTPLTDIAEITAGFDYSCARLTNGEARCWGANDRGQLGDGTTTDSVLPVVVSNPAGTGPLTDIATITAGRYHTCVQLTTGEARCWGANNSGKLGNGTTTDSPRPVVVSNPAGTGPLTDIAEINANQYHTCARLTNGEARCWGYNGHGRLGDGTTTSRTRPVVVSNPTGTGPLTGITQLTAGTNHTCARLVNNEARCWGWNPVGQLGDGTTTSRSRPVVVSNTAGSGALTGVTEITAGYDHTCARLTRQVRCWGSNLYGQLGDGTTTPQLRPVAVLDPGAGLGPLTGVASVNSGYFFTCAGLTNGEARCWGFGRYGQLGDGVGRRDGSALPVVVSNPAGTGPLTEIADLGANRYHACARTADGGGRCWGNNPYGQLGDGSTTRRSRPVVVSTL